MGYSYAWKILFEDNIGVLLSRKEILMSGLDAP